ncbi:restriction endonuclease [Poriferisphaera sp. WC338]|uniref:restriction endonuclease n=1 Tax=Poriferisphaera sp. WC338 TaxID=3425129 RepID=UPI003D813534
MYEIEVRHDGLNKYRHIRGSDRYIVEQKALAQQRAWDEMWEKRLAAEEKKLLREQAAQEKEDNREQAADETEEALEALREIETLLHHTLGVNDEINWELLIDRVPFSTPSPQQATSESLPPKPDRLSKVYNPKLGLFERLFKGRKVRENAENIFNRDVAIWEQEVIRVERENDRKVRLHREALKEWEDARERYGNSQREHNQKVLDQKEKYLGGDSDAILDYCEMVLANSDYPDCIPMEWELDYLTDSGVLIVDYSLPSIDRMPRLKSVKYVASRDEFSKTYITDAALNKTYDSALYQISLRTIHELFEADTIDCIKTVVFNGWVNSLDKSTGHYVNACIMSLQASKEAFLKINLAGVDPKACFKQLKGVGSSKLHGMSAVAPILKIDKEDRRFVPAYEVIDGVTDEDNLAAMDWKDFENLIREVFEKEFTVNGCEVKITRASRDGGVDAVAFDPDPIRGGKIVIQAKRYTNTVGVSAVRDLFGTTVNEGAIKGILVTTADYGPDAYEFAQGKPLTLLSGGNLLSLLEKHGHRAKIDLKEAKQLLAEQKA